MLAIYIRVSTEMQSKKYSLEVQEQKGIEFAASIGETYKIYREVESGKYISNREELNELWNDIERGEVQKVWVIEHSRISRDTEDAIKIKKHFLKYNVELYIDGQFVDLNKKDSVFMYNIKSSVSEYERSNTIERIKRGKEQQINEGKQTFARMYGYSYEYDKQGNKIWFINEREAEIIKLVYQLFNEGFSFRKMELELNRRKIPKKYSKNGWNINQIVKMLRRPVYAGYVRDKKGNLIESKIYPPIITKEEYDNVQKEWRTIRRIHHLAIQFEHSDHQCSSIIKCIECKGNFIHEYTKAKKSGGYAVYDYYFAKHKKGCSRKSIRRHFLPASHIDNIFSTLYYLTVSDYAEAEKLNKEKQKAIEYEKQLNNEIIGKIDKEIDEHKKAMNKLLDAVENMESLDYNDINERINEHKKAIQKLINEKNKSFKHIDELEREYEIMLSEFGEKSILKFMNAESGERRKILLGIIKNCIMEDLKITVQFISGKRYEIQVPEKLRFKVSDVYKIKIIDGVESRINDFVFHADKNILSYGPGRNDYRVVMKWVRDTERTIKEGKAIAPLST